MNIEIKELQDGDIGWIISSHGEIYVKDFGFDVQFELDIAEKAVNFCNKEDDIKRFFIAWVDGKKAACIAISKKDGLKDASFVNFFFVLHEFRGLGLANRLMDELINYSKEVKLPIITLETYSCLESAREVYKKYNFKIYKENKNIQKYGFTFNQEFWKLELSS